MRQPNYAPCGEKTLFAPEVSLAKEAAIFKLLGNPGRMRILAHLQQGSRTVRQVWEPLGLRQPAVSQQLTMLKHLGIIQGRRTGSEMRYFICDPLVKRIIAVLHTSIE